MAQRNIFATLGAKGANGGLISLTKSTQPFGTPFTGVILHAIRCDAIRYDMNAGPLILNTHGLGS